MFAIKPSRRILLAVALITTAAFAQVSYLDQLPTGDRWIQHLNQDLLPFWTVPAALGNPLGAFPSTRCDDGSLLDFRNPCSPIAGNSYLMTRARYLVPLSRQSYGYGVAYHLTGDPKYFEYMKAGIDYIRRNALDPPGGMFTTLDLTTNTWGPRREFRNPQELGYGLLSLAFYYYLTRDDSVLADLLAAKKYILDSYYNPSLGTMQWLLQNNGSQRFDQKQLVADLDQMNTYLVLTAPLLPEPYQSEWKQSLTTLSRSMLGTFYSPLDNLFFTGATAPSETDLALTGVDFGHTSKALWMIRWTGLMTGDQGLVQFVETAGKRLFDRAFLTDDGSWAQGVLAGGSLDRNKNWWIYAELDQYAGTLALVDAAAGRYLPSTTDYYFKYFIDTRYGEVWNGVNYGTNTPQRDYPKSWQWKSTYHSFEHALVGYITSQYLHQQPVRLYYAFQKTPDPTLVRPYFFPGEIQSVDFTTGSDGAQYQAVTFRGAAPPPAPAFSVTSAASFLPVPLAPGSIASLFGTIPDQPSVTIRDMNGTVASAKLLYVSPSQVNFLVPEGIAAGSGTLTLATFGREASMAVQLATAAPGLFLSNAATGLVAAYAIRVKADQSQAVEELTAPLDLGPATDTVHLSLYGTGIRNASNVTVTVGGQPVAVGYKGAQGTWPGLDQVNVGPLPRSLAGRGRVTVVLNAGGQTANPVQFAIK